MLKKLWLVFAQAVTILLALLFTFATLRPEWLPQRLARERPPLSLPAPAPASRGEPGAANAPPPKPALRRAVSHRFCHTARRRAGPPPR